MALGPQRKKTPPPPPPPPPKTVIVNVARNTGKHDTITITMEGDHTTVKQLKKILSKEHLDGIAINRLHLSYKDKPMEDHDEVLHITGGIGKHVTCTVATESFATKPAPEESKEPAERKPIPTVKNVANDQQQPNQSGSPASQH